MITGVQDTSEDRYISEDKRVEIINLELSNPSPGSW